MRTPLPFSTITSTHCIKMRESVVLFVAGAAESMTDMFPCGAVTLDASVELSRPSSRHAFTVMKTLMIAARQYFQVLWAVIQRVAIDVVCVLVGLKFAAKFLGEHNPMLKVPCAWVRDFHFHVEEAFDLMRAPRTYGVVAHNLLLARVE